MMIKMEIEDIPQILEIEKESFTTPWSEEAFTIEIEENSFAEYIVAELDGKIIAYGGVWKILYSSHITNIAVREEFRGKGYGKKILEALIYLSEIDNVMYMTLEVREKNYVAQALYKKYGFVEDGIKENYYVDVNEDAILMRRINRKV